MLTLPGLRPVLLVTGACVLAHNILYTYIAPFLSGAGLMARTDLALLVFGCSSLLSIVLTGMLIDDHLRSLTLGSLLLFALAALALYGHLPWVTLCGCALWGLAFGGAETLFQTASAKTAGSDADVARSMIVTIWNLAIAGGGIVGGVLLEYAGSESLPWVLLLLLVPAWLVAWHAREQGFR